MSYSFRHLPKGSTVGTGDYLFRHYGEEGGLDNLCFTSGANNSFLYLTGQASGEVPVLEISYDNIIWENYTIDTRIKLNNIGDKVYIRGDNDYINTTYSGAAVRRYKFMMSGKIYASGDIMSLLSKTLSKTRIPERCFDYFFDGCTALVTPPKISATYIGAYGCRCLFSETSITEAPELSFTTVSRCGLLGMFYGCSSLVSPPPILSATTLYDNMEYYNMFNGCTSLQTAPIISATNITRECCSNMFKNCTSLTTPPALPATFVSSKGYENMFYGCTSLTTVPLLPATSVQSSSYNSMFYGCTSLKVYSSSDVGHEKVWKIPTSGSISPGNTQTTMFYGTDGDYSSASTVNLNSTFYTQNTPV